MCAFIGTKNEVFNFGQYYMVPFSENVRYPAPPVCGAGGKLSHDDITLFSLAL